MRAILVVLALLLAGCSGDAPEAPEELAVQDVEPVSRTTGSISGVVVDETISPVSGAMVELLGQSKNTTTNELGQFVFEGLEPGTYFVKASAYAHDTTQSSVDIKAGDVAKPRILIASVPVQEPYHTTYKRDTYNVLSVPVVIVYYGGEYVELDGPFETLVVDGNWRGDLFIPLDPATAISTCISTDPSGFSSCYNTPQEFSIRVDNEDQIPEETVGLDWNSKPGFDSISVQAQGEMFFTSFYHGAAPPEWSLHNGDS